MPLRTTSAKLATGVGLLALTITGCTAATPQPTPSETSVVLQSPDSPTVTVADDPSVAERAAATSAALFHSSPGVIVIDAGDDASASRATTLAAGLHVPVLVADPAAGSDAGSGAADREARRLDASWYIGIGGARLHAGGLDRRPAADTPRPLTVRRPSRASVVVTSNASDDAAAVATAKAAGAKTVAMPADSKPADAAGATDPATKIDIASTPDVIDALHSASADATLLLGSGFRQLGDPEWAVRAARTGWQLPGGGQRPFAAHRSVALYGAPGAPALGVLGEQDPAATMQRVEQLAAQYKPLSDEPVVPAVEIIASVAAGSPGDDGDYSNELPVEQLQPYIDAARAVHASVIIDLQPGRSDFLTQAKHYESLLTQPDVGLALDPEWRLAPDQVPLRQIGSVGADEVNGVSSWLADLVKRHDLPPKMFVLHQFRLSMLQDRSRIDVSHPELDTLIHVDGQGSQPDKQATWKALHQGAQSGISWGWKNFYDEDAPVLTPEQTLQQVLPTPDLITYQ